MTIQFSDRAVPYNVFLNDLADAVAERMRKKMNRNTSAKMKRSAASVDPT